MKQLYISLLGILVLSSCSLLTGENQNQNLQGTSQGETLHDEPKQTVQYEQTDYGISVIIPNTVETVQERGYLMPDSWSALPLMGSGTILTEFVLPGSNEILAAGLRIGVSEEESALQECLSSPNLITPVKQEIAQDLYTVMELSDAAMNHQQTVWSYRLVKNSVCYVFDTYIAGSNPEVYEKPPLPAFSKDEARNRLVEIMSTVKVASRQ